MKNPNFVFGEHRTFSKAGSGDSYPTISLAEIYLMTNNPPSVPKEKGSWVIPSTYTDHDARKHSVQRERGSFRLLTGDVDEGDVSLEALCKALTEVFGNADRIVYSTASATEQHPRWHFLIPLKYPIAGVNYKDVQNLIADRLGGLGIECDRAMARAGQCVALPNRNKDFYEFDMQWFGNLFDPSRYVEIAEHDREDRERDRQAAAVKDEGIPPDKNVIAAFNRRFPAQMLMKQYGYKQRGGDFRSPLQQGKTYATRVMENGRWVSLSTSDREIGYFNGEVTCGDSFDLFRYFDARNDWKLALQIAARECFGDKQ